MGLAYDVFVKKGIIIQDMCHFRFLSFSMDREKYCSTLEVNEQYRRYKIRKNVENAPSPLLNLENKTKEHDMKCKIKL